MSARKMNICDIIICVWNQWEVTKDCIESIHKNTKYPYRLVLIDNASDQETQDYLKSVKKDGRCEVIIIRNEKNLGNTKAVNQGLLATDAPYVCNLDNDTIVTDGWLTEMVEAAQSDAQIGIVTAAGRGSFPPKSDSIEDIEEMARVVSKRRGQTLEMATVDCFCALFKRTMINKIGVWDEAFSPGYFDDTEYCRRATRNGFKIVSARGAYVYHREGGSFKKSKRKMEIWERNEKRYHWMYGKSKRLLYIADSKEDAVLKKIKNDIYRNARNANWVWFFRPRSLNGFEMNEHSHLKEFIFSDFLFTLKVLFKVLLRQKKRFDYIYVSSKSLKSLLNAFKAFHRADVRLSTNVNF